MKDVTAAVVITTKNRREDLRRALVSCQAQRSPVKTLVVDDGSTDGTTDMVRSDFPNFIVESSATSKGYIVQRNLAARLLDADIILSIDDDAVFSAEDIVAHTVREFDDPRIGAVAIPFVNVNTGPRVFQRAPDQARRWVTDSFTGTAYAVRRDLFLKLGGFCESLVHQGEEGDYCIRMLDAGYFVRLGSAAPILHFESPKRDRGRMNYYGCRNLVVFCWQNVPFPDVLAHLGATTAKLLMQGVRGGRLAGVVAGYRLVATGRVARAPVGRRTYRLSRRLKKRGALDLAYLEGRP